MALVAEAAQSAIRIRSFLFQARTFFAARAYVLLTIDYRCPLIAMTVSPEERLSSSWLGRSANGYSFCDWWEWAGRFQLHPRRHKFARFSCGCRTYIRSNSTNLDPLSLWGCGSRLANGRGPGGVGCSAWSVCPLENGHFRPHPCNRHDSWLIVHYVATSLRKRVPGCKTWSLRTAHIPT